MANLTHLSFAAAICAVLGSPVLVAQRARPPQPQRPPDKYNAALPRLPPMTGLNVANWRAHAADIPHGEDPALDDSQWTAITLAGGGRGNGGGGGAAAPGSGHAWYRTVIEIPATVGGKDIRGARVRLMVRLS